MKVNFTNAIYANNTVIDNTKNISLTDGFFHPNLKSYSVFLNGTQKLSLVITLVY